MRCTSGGERTRRRPTRGQYLSKRVAKEADFQPQRHLLYSDFAPAATTTASSCSPAACGPTVVDKWLLYPPSADAPESCLGVRLGAVHLALLIEAKAPVAAAHHP